MCHRYKGVALNVDGERAAITPTTHDPATDPWCQGPFDMLAYRTWTGGPISGRIFQLDWTIEGDDQWAQLQFLEIDYEGILCQKI